MKKLIILIIPLFLNCSKIPKDHEASEPHLDRLSFQSTATNLERDFYVYVPKGYDDNEDDWPILLFLHGNGERGDAKDELDFVLVHGPMYEAWAQKRDLPFIIVAPQLPMWGMDEVSYIKNREIANIPQRLAVGVPERNSKFEVSQPMTGSHAAEELNFGPEGLPVGYPDMEDDLMAILDLVETQYRTDKNRYYLAGLSYGGFGTWFMASNHPEVWAAINPVVGWGHPDLMGPIAEHKVPVWAFAGGRDNAVPVQYFYAGLNKLEELGHEVRFTTEEDMGHDVWSRVYAGEDIYNWLLSNSLGN